MYFEQFYLGCLAHASYMIGSESVAAVVDPQRDVDGYLEQARAQELRIAHVIETHLHADFVSGHRELAERTGAEIWVGAAAGATFPHRDAREGDEVRFGKCRLRFLETPGHTPESICVLIADLERSPAPFAVLTGDTLFIGDVGRPDLSPGFTPQDLAAMLHDSLHRKLLSLPDDLLVYPAHGAGSLCGRNIGKDRFSTIGRERISNYALRPMSRAEFVEMLTAQLPERPAYFASDAELNRAGASSMSGLPPLQPLDGFEVLRRQREGAVVLDTRPAQQFGEGHVPGSIHIGLSGQYASWAGILLGLEAELVLVAEDAARVAESRMRLARVGIERVAGYLEDGIGGWRRAYLPLESVPQIEARELDRLLGEKPRKVRLIDVRRPAEWQEGHIEAAELKPLHQLQRLLDDFDAQVPLAVYCQGGYRSSMACSILRRAGFAHVMNLVGGFEAWKAADLPRAAADPERDYLKTWSSNQAAEYQESLVVADDRELALTTFRLGDTWHAKVEIPSFGVVLTRASGATRAQAEKRAIAAAGGRLAAR
jgi:hydroxyacylglutathione hydrolase